MFRFLFQFIALLIFFAIARKVLTFLTRTVVGSFRATSQTPPSNPSSGNNELLSSAGELHQDPVCGTFVPGSSDWNRKVDGQTVYFCSAECRDRFLVSAHS